MTRRHICPMTVARGLLAHLEAQEGAGKITSVSLNKAFTSFVLLLHFCMEAAGVEEEEREGKLALAWKEPSRRNAEAAVQAQLVDRGASCLRRFLKVRAGQLSRSSLTSLSYSLRQAYAWLKAAGTST